MWLTLLLCAFLSFAFFILDSRKPKNFPPGPIWWPVVGCIFEVLRLRKKLGTLCMATTTLAKKHGKGKMVGLRVGRDIQVVVTSADAATEMLMKPELDGRPCEFFHRLRTWGLRRGILVTDEEFWREQRRFVVRHLRNFGLGRSRQMESNAIREVQALEDHFRRFIKSSKGGKAVVPLHDAFSLPMLNTIWVMLAGTRYDLDDVELHKLQNIMDNLFASVDMTGCLLSQFPVLRFLMPEKSGYNHYVQSYQKLWSFLQEELLRHQASYVEGTARDFMDVYIAELKSRQDEDSSFSELQLIAICMDLFIAGSDTTSKTLSFGFLHFLRNPKVVKKVQQEIDQVVGRDRKVTLEDRPKLPYTEATVYEAFRAYGAHAFGIPHRALHDSTLMGYSIPKGTVLTVNYNGILMDEKLYKDPLAFNPERFLNDHNQVVIPESFANFGEGQHRCPGESVAKCNIFLFIANLLQTFNFENPPGCDLPDPFPVDGLFPSTQPYDAQVSLRV